MHFDQFFLTIYFFFAFFFFCLFATDTEKLDKTIEIMPYVSVALRLFLCCWLGCIFVLYWSYVQCHVYPIQYGGRASMRGNVCEVKVLFMV